MTFRPWTGDHYRRGAFFGQKVLLIGLSHYDSEMRNHAEFTRDTIREVCDGAPINFFTSLGHACVGRAAYDANPARFWHSVAFFNFVDRLVGPTHNSEPDAAMLKEAKRKFLPRVEALKPDRIIVFSATVWSNLPPFADQTDGANFYAAEPHDAWMGYYRLANGLVPIMYAKHPNARGGWAASKWRELVMRFLMEPLPEPRFLDATMQQKPNRRSRS